MGGRLFVQPSPFLTGATIDFIVELKITGVNKLSVIRSKQPKGTLQ